MDVVCITQARLASRRLPNKVLIPLYSNFNALSILSQRLRYSKSIDRHLFAVSDEPNISPILDFLRSASLDFQLGSPHDLALRYAKVLSDYDDCIIVRVTSDCPLVDPCIVDQAVKIFVDGNFDYVSNYTPANLSLFCNGSDVEVFTKATLKRLINLFPSLRDREHITFPLWDGRMPDIRHYLMSPTTGCDYSDVRITLDYEEDASVLRKILLVSNNIYLNLHEIVQIYRQQSLFTINGNHHYSEGWS